MALLNSVLKELQLFLLHIGAFCVIFNFSFFILDLLLSSKDPSGRSYFSCFHSPAFSFRSTALFFGFCLPAAGVVLIRTHKVYKITHLWFNQWRSHRRSLIKPVESMTPSTFWDWLSRATALQAFCLLSSCLATFYFPSCELWEYLCLQRPWVPQGTVAPCSESILLNSRSGVLFSLNIC